jgi:competence protein ComEC
MATAVYPASVLHEVPLLRWVLGLAGGMGLSRILPTNVFPILLATGLLLLLWGSGMFRLQTKNPRLRFQRQITDGCIGWLLLLLSGFVLTALVEKPVDQRIPPTGRLAVYRLRVNEPPEEKRNQRIQAEALLLEQIVAGQRLEASGTIMLRITGKEHTLPIQYGDECLVRGVLQPFATPRNPGAFDFAAWQWRQGRFAQLDAEAQQLYVTGENSGNRLKRFTGNLRKQWILLIHQFVEHPVDQAVAGNILLGYKGAMDTETLQAYAVSGTLHILSVSGLHVGVLYAVLNLLLGFADRQRITRVLKWLFLLVILGIYALLTGLSPSVLRSVWMCGLLLTGQTFSRRTSGLNILAASALVLWVANPHLASDSGFQLSYAAVWGIMYIYPRLMPEQTNWPWIGQKGAEAIGVAIAAQIATLPLSLHAFYQFPVWFLPANLVAVPVGNICLLSGMALFATQPIPLVHEGCGWVLKHSVQLLNQFVGEVESWPFASWKALYISTTEAVAMGIGIGLFFYLKTHFRFRIVLGCLLCVFVFTASRQVRKTRREQREELWLFGGTRQPLLLYAAGSRAVLLGNPQPYELRQLDRFLAAGGWEWQIDRLPTDRAVVLRLGQQRGVIYPALAAGPLPGHEPVDWIICQGIFPLWLAVDQRKKETCSIYYWDRWDRHVKEKKEINMAFHPAVQLLAK